MLGWVRRRPLLVYYLLALLIACGVVVNGILAMSVNADAAAAFAYLGGDITNAGGYVSIPWIFQFALEQPVLFGIFVFAAAPSLAALVVAALAGRLGRLGAKLRPWARDVPWTHGAAIYLAIFALYGAGLALFSWFAFLNTGAEGLNNAWRHLGAFGLSGFAFALPALLLDEGGSLEELGWRGFALDGLSERYSAFAAALVLGVLWWAWHLPREAITILGGAAISQFLWQQFVFLLLCVGLSVVIAYAWNRVGGSIWVGVLIHGGTNVWSKAFGEAADAVFGGWEASLHPMLRSFDLRTVIVLALAAALLALTGLRLGRAPSVEA
jgi:membrane protease YdiL (CAAX protease family)